MSTSPTLSSHDPQHRKRKRGREAVASRTLQACLPCRRRKIKCNGQRPRCQHCARFEDVCDWPSSGSTNPYNPAVSNPSIQASRTLLSSEQSRALVECFFTAPQLTLLRQAFHEPTFSSSDFEQHALFLQISICCLSALNLPLAILQRLFGRESATELSARLASIGQRLSMESCFQPTVEHTQANILMAWRELVAGNTDLAWLYTGHAIRMAQSLRLGKEYHQRHPVVAREVRRRTMWLAFITDRLISYVLARPQTIGTRKLTIQLPCSESTFTFEEYYQGPSIHEFGLSGSVTSDSVFPYVIKAFDSWGTSTDIFANLALSTNSPTADYKDELRQAEADLEAWSLNLPQRMRWSAQNYRAHKRMGDEHLFVILQMLLLHSRCITQQCYLPLEDLFGPPSLSGSAAAGACLRNAELITNIATHLFDGDDTDRANLCSPICGVAIACAAHIWLWALRAIGSPQSGTLCDLSNQMSEAQSKLDSLTKILRSWATTWTLAQTWLDIINLLSKYYGIVFGNEAIEMADFDDAEDTATIRDHVSIGSGFPEPYVTQDIFKRIFILTSTVAESPDLRRQHTRLQMQTSWRQVWLGSLSALPEFGSVLSQMSPGLLEAATDSHAM